MILVVGATGVLGGMITRRLLEQGHRVRILVRPNSACQSLVEAGAKPFVGDLRDRASLDRACAAARVVITTANSALRGGDDNVETVELQGNRNLIDAAREAGVEQFVFVSVLGVSEGSPIPFLAAKAASERYLRESGIPYTILAPNLFMEGWIPMLVGTPVHSGTPVTLVGEARRRHAMVSVTDVAAFAVAAVGNPAALDRHIPIGGPSAVSWREVVDAAGQALGHPLEVRFIRPGEAIPGLPEAVSQFAAAMDTYDSPLDMDETARRFGVTLTPMEAFLNRAFTRRSEDS